MKFNRNSYVSTKRDAWVEINLANLENNVLEIKKHLKENVKLLAVIKADAYGHGAVMSAPVLLASGVDMFGVASIDEAQQLREAGITSEILVLGAVPVWAVEYAAQNNITISIFSDEHIEACRQTYVKTKIKPKVHIKLDTGMNRIGITQNNAVDFIKNVQSADYIDLKGIFTHFANAENREKTEKQINIFKNILSQIDTSNLTIHCANSAAIMTYEDLQFDMVRAGIILYGLMPDIAPNPLFLPNLKRVMGLKGRITNIHNITQGEGVSYGHTYICADKAKVATIPIGYADGVSRNLSNKIKACVNNKEIKQIGNITMDQMMFDLCGTEAQEGDIVTLLDDTNTIDEWAKILNTINYELTCRLKVRLSRVYVR